MEGQVADLKRRIPILRRLIADCDRMAAALDQEVRNEEDRVKIHDPANSAYSTYAKATASRRDNLRRSADQLRAHLANAEKALLERLVRAVRRLSTVLSELRHTHKEKNRTAAFSAICGDGTLWLDGTRTEVRFNPANTQ